jgi:hypothetical protein
MLADTTAFDTPQPITEDQLEQLTERVADAVVAFCRAYYGTIDADSFIVTAKRYPFYP